MLLLRDPNRFTLPLEYVRSAEAAHTVVGFFCLLSRKASSIFSQIFDQIRTCCYATRDWHRTIEFMYAIAKHLGYMHKEIGCFHTTLAQWDCSVSLQYMSKNWLIRPSPSRFMKSSSMHLRLSMISRIFPWGSALKPSPLAAYPTPYSSVESTSHLPRLIPGSRASTQSIIRKAYFRIPFWKEADRFYSIRNQKMSFLHLLRCSTVQNPGWTPSTINGYGHALRRQNNSFNDASRYNYLQVVSNSGERISEDFDRHISGTSASMLIRDQSSSGFRKVQEEAYATLDPAWTLDLDDTSALKDVQGSDYMHDQPADPSETSMPDFQVDENQNLLQESYQDLGDVPVYEGLQENEPVTDGARPHPQKDLADPRHYNHTTGNIAFDTSDHDCAMLGPSQGNTKTEKPPSKRKRIKSFLSRKERRLIPSQLSRSELSGSPDTICAARSTPNIEKPPKVTHTTITGTRLARLPGTDHSPRIVDTNWVVDWERAGSRDLDLNGGTILKDVNISESDRRPLSRPRRATLRKSLDISVAVLRRNFEKLSST